MKTSKELYKEYQEAVKREAKANKKLTEKQAKILLLYKNGRSILGIHKDTGINYSYIHDFLRQQGLKRNERN